jgi:small GTP-binding protein
MVLPVDDGFTRCKLTEKITIIGNSNVGKTALIQRYLKGYFGTTSATISLAYNDITLGSGENTFRCQLWDTAGQELYDALTPTYLRGSDVVLVCYSIDDPASRLRLEHWLDKVSRYADNPYVIIIATKTDLMEANDVKLSVSEVGQRYNLQVLPCSALNDYGVNEIFNYITQLLIDRTHG